MTKSCSDLHKNTYAEKFFKPIKPGMIGGEIAGEVEAAKKEKPYKLFATMNDMMKQ
jgi:hypothetical protein